MIVTVAGFLFDSKIDWIIGTEWFNCRLHYRDICQYLTKKVINVFLMPIKSNGDGMNFSK